MKVFEYGLVLQIQFSVFISKIKEFAANLI